jgi:hypothetical protein
MKREELIDALESDAIKIDEDISSTNTPEPGNSEAIRIAVAKIKEKRTKNGKVYGVKDKEGNPHKRLTASMQLFVNHLLAGDTKLMAYRKAYNVKTENDASVIGNANKLLRDQRITALLGSLSEVVREKVIEDSVRTRRHVMEELFKHAQQAKTEGTQLKALELMGRAVGMFTDKVETKVEEINTEKLKAELKSHLTLLENVAPIKKRSA